MRYFPYITVGRILVELKDEGLPLTRVTFYRKEKILGLPKPQKTSGKLRWRVYTREQADEVKKRLKKEYNFS